MKPFIICVAIGVFGMAVAMAGERPYDITWMPESDIMNGWPTGNVFPVRMNVTPNAHSPKSHIIKGYEFVVCSSDFSRSVVVSFAPPVRVGEFYSGMIGYLSEEQINQLAGLGDGTYYAGFVVSGVRCSNVAAFTVNAASPPPNGPAIRVMGIPDLDKDVIAEIGYWVVPPNDADSKSGLTNFSATYPELWIDGVVHKPAGGSWIGPVGPLRAHTISGFMIQLATKGFSSRFDPAIAPFKAADVQVVIGEYKSEVTRVSVDRTIERKFDSYLMKAAG